MEAFAACWEGLEGPRTGNAARHDFHDLLMIALCTVLAGGENATDMAEVAIDGKVLRRSYDRASGKSALHMVSAWGCEQRMVLAQIATDEKSNEITAVLKLLKMLSLKNTVVAVDALNRQRGDCVVDGPIDHG